MSSRRLVAILAIVGIVVLAGCAGVPGGAVDGPSLEDDPSGETSDTPESDPTAADDGDPTDPDGEMSVHMLNVGQGSSTLIVGPEGETILIDSGDWRDGGEDVIAYLEAQGITRIDHLVTSHADADHIGGHAAIIEHFETNADGIGAVYDPGIASTSATYDNYLDAVEEHEVTLYRAQAGDTIEMAGMDAQILAPPEGYLASEDRNENSIVVHIQFGTSSFLLPGDGETASEEYLQETYGEDLASTILAAGHHGSGSSTSDAFLETVSPQAVVISSAYDSQYGHPHEEVLSRLDARSIPTYWTATHGTIRLTSNGSSVTVATQQDAPTAGAQLRPGELIEPGSERGLTDRLVLSADGTGSPSVPETDDSSTETDGDGDDSETDDSAGSEALEIAEIHADAEGNDNENLNDEYMIFENTGDSSIDLSGWTIADEAGHTYTVPEGKILDAGERMTLYSGSGTDTSDSLYWNRDRAVWNNDGDTVIVRDGSGTVVLEETY